MAHNHGSSGAANGSGGRTSARSVDEVEKHVSRILRKRYKTLDEKALPLVDPESMIVLKIDTQGWEMDVLRGASELLRTRAL